MSDKVPPLAIPAAQQHFEEELSPKSEEFRENTGMLLAFTMNHSSSIANCPLPSVIKESKNPLLSTQNVLALKYENEQLKEQLHNKDKEIRRLKVLMREKDSEINDLRESLEAAWEECESLRSSSCSVSATEGGPVSSREVYSRAPPKRIWRDPVPELTSELDQLKFKLKNLIVLQKKDIVDNMYF